MTQQSRLEALVAAVGADVKELDNITMWPTGSEPSFAGITGPHLWIEYTP